MPPKVLVGLHHDLFEEGVASCNFRLHSLGLYMVQGCFSRRWLINDCACQVPYYA